MTPFIMRFFVPFSAAVLLLGLTAASGVCETMVTPSIGVRAAYDDNTLGKGDSDAELMLSPAFKVEGGDEVTRLGLQGRLDAFQYAEHDEYSRENVQFGANVSHAASERLVLRLGARWVRDHTVESEFDESGITTEKVARNSYTATPGLTLRLTERDELSLDGSAGLVRYERTGFTDYQMGGLTTTWSHALGDGLWRVIGQAGAQAYRFDLVNGETSQLVLSALVGFAWKASETLEFQVMGGASQTESEVEFDSGLSLDDSQLTFSGSVSATWTDEVWKLTLSADRSESPSTYGELITRDRLRATFGRNLSERLYLGAQLAWYMSKTSGLVQDENTQTYSLGPTLRYRLTEDCTLDGGYLYTHEDDIEASEITDRNRVYLGVTMDWPGVW
ncbi:Putative beta-barrel porin 2 [Desulfomicrobium norvegicum]|uniref:Beta-barrel porin 2 n=1 Tax=Desulfomicrobium norvegicum (strain DSM 1741 / NCIMB 8310) TaxID=52561 RepID=A0A8G2C3R6_DESNO|nr:outer membrane beta-barrel protein [Desulfomicrobium norvegicum]SFL76360.1 Putative beta-barrel porin 2 [Desulfomicrobium norvegicum]